MKHSARMLSLILTLLFALAAICPAALAEEEITVKEDTSSTYTPTQIVNGDFTTEPFVDFDIYGRHYTVTTKDSSVEGNVEKKYYNGVDGGWNTTEIKLYLGNLFERYTSDSAHGSHLKGRCFVDMNNANAAVLWQDLTTTGGDIIRWTLDHGVSTHSSSSATQDMRVEIGGPKRDSSGNIQPATGLGVDSVNPQIEDSTNATYKYTGVTKGSGTTGFGKAEELVKLRVTKSADNTGWRTVKGVYIVPDKQSVTRFAFISEAENPIAGNELSRLTFSTLLGNLSASEGKNRSVIIKGYWGDSDSGKKLCVKNGDTVLEIDMSAVLNKNFIVTIPASKIGSTSDTVTVYHQDYPSAFRKVKLHEPAVPATGDNNMPLLFATLLLLAGAGLGVLKKRSAR